MSATGSSFVEYAPELSHWRRLAANIHKNSSDNRTSRGSLNFPGDSLRTKSTTRGTQDDYPLLLLQIF